MNPMKPKLVDRDLLKEIRHRFLRVVHEDIMADAMNGINRHIRWLPSSGILRKVRRR